MQRWPWCAFMLLVSACTAQRPALPAQPSDISGVSPLDIAPRHQLVFNAELPTEARRDPQVDPSLHAHQDWHLHDVSSLEVLR